MKTFRKYVFSMFPLTYSGLLNRCDGACGNSRNHLETDACFMFPVTGFRLTNVLFQNYLSLAESKFFSILLLPETHPYYVHGR